MPSYLQKRETKMYEFTYVQIERDLLLGDVCKYIFNQISKLTILFPFFQGKRRKEQRNNM